LAGDADLQEGGRGVFPPAGIARCFPLSTGTEGGIVWKVIPSPMTKVTPFERILAKDTRLLYDVQMKEKFHNFAI
jgi:hypothetical protein